MQRGFNAGLLGLLAVGLLAFFGHPQDIKDDHGGRPSALSATLIVADELELRGRIDFVGDTDCFMFEAQTGSRYTLAVTRASAPLTPLILLFDRDGATTLALDDQGTPDVPAQIVWRPETGGFYYVCVRNAVATAGVGDYTLSVKRDVPSVTVAPPGSSDASSNPNPAEPTMPPVETKPATMPSSEQGRTEDPNVGLSVGVLGADDPNSLDDVKDVLERSGAFVSVAIVDLTATTPTGEELDAFDAVLVWSDNGFADADTLGDHLADYVDRGGGVVVAAVSFDAPDKLDPDALGGRFLDQNYYAIQPGADNVGNGRRRLGALALADHPLLKGVDTVDGGPSSFHSPTTTLTSGSSLVASWDNGDVLVAVKMLGQTRRADLNVFPPSGRTDLGLWPFRPSNDVPQLFVNALRWVAGAGP